MNCSLFTSLLHPKVIKWDIFINKLKEPTEVPDKELKKIGKEKGTWKALDHLQPQEVLKHSSQ